MKRGIYGTFHHVWQQHLKRYLAEFDFRYNERSALGVKDAERMAKSVRGIVGNVSLIKHLVFRRSPVMSATAAMIEPWRRRLYIPSYQVGEAARYAGISPQTVAAWHRIEGNKALLSQKEQRAALSYLQLIEVAVVAAFRKAGVKLPDIKAAREYVQITLKSEYPFAQYRFKTEVKSLWLDYGRGKLLKANQAGQLAWKDIIGRLQEFEYERKGVVVRWHVTGPGSKSVLHPRIAFGAPTVDGSVPPAGKKWIN